MILDCRIIRGRKKVGLDKRVTTDQLQGLTDWAVSLQDTTAVIWNERPNQSEGFLFFLRISSQTCISLYNYIISLNYKRAQLEIIQANI